MSAADNINERRLQVFVSPDAKRMLRELGQRWFPNLKRPDGSVLEKLIRDAFDQEQKR